MHQMEIIRWLSGKSKRILCKVPHNCNTRETSFFFFSAGGVLFSVLLDTETNDKLYLLFITKKLLLTAVTGKVKTCNFLWISQENVCSGMCKCKEFKKNKKGWLTLFSATEMCFNRLWTCQLCQPASRGTSRQLRPHWCRQPALAWEHKPITAPNEQQWQEKNTAF